jgi:hypothetical protein
MYKVYGKNPDGSLALLAVPDTQGSASYIDSGSWAFDFSAFDFTEYAVFTSGTISGGINVTAFTDIGKVTLNGIQGGSGNMVSPFNITGTGSGADYYASRGISNPNGWVTGSYPGVALAAKAGPAVLSGTQQTIYYTEITIVPNTPFDSFALDMFADLDNFNYAQVYVIGNANQGVLATYGNYSGSNAPVSINGGDFGTGYSIRIGVYNGTVPPTGLTTNSFYVDFDSLKITPVAGATGGSGGTGGGTVPPATTTLYTSLTTYNQAGWIATGNFPGHETVAQSPSIVAGTNTAIIAYQLPNFTRYQVPIFLNTMDAANILQIEVSKLNGSSGGTFGPYNGTNLPLNFDTGELGFECNALVFTYSKGIEVSPAKSDFVAIDFNSEILTDTPAVIPPATPRYFRLNISSVTGGNNPVISEFNTYNASGVINSGGTYTSDGTADATPQNVGDGDINTSWNGSIPNGGKLQIQYAADVTVHEYSITSSATYGPNTSPTAFTFESSLDGISWTVLDTQSGQAWGYSTVKTFTLA